MKGYLNGQVVPLSQVTSSPISGLLRPPRRRASAASPNPGSPTATSVPAGPAAECGHTRRPLGPVPRMWQRCPPVSQDRDPPAGGYGRIIS